jgi:short-subunit dehydrogenase
MVQSNSPTFALITSACSHTGKMYAYELAERGMNLLLIDMSGMGLEELAIDLKKFHVIVKWKEIDFLKKEHLFEFSNWIQQGFKIKLLINIASFECKGSFLESQIEYIHRIFQMNIRSTNTITQMVLPLLLQQNQASLFNVSSLGDISLMNYKTVYKSSRNLIKQYTENLKTEFRYSNVNVRWIDLGYHGKRETIGENLNFISRLISFNFRSHKTLVAQSISSLKLNSYISVN